MSDFFEKMQKSRKKNYQSKKEEKIRNKASLGPNNSWKAEKFDKKKPKHLILMKWWALMFKN